MSSAPSAASQFCRHILVKLILLDFIHVVGFFLFVLKLHQLHKDGVNNARINLRDISGGRVYLMCLPRLSCVREVRFARSVKHGLIERASQSENWIVRDSTYIARSVP